VPPFDPLFRNPHLATLAGNFWPRDYSRNPYPEESRLFDTVPGVRVLGVVQRPRQTSRGHAILLHGLEGSHESGYMRSMAQTALDAGFAVTRLNMRTCGGTEDYAKTLYHAGLTEDLAAVVERRDGPVHLIGYSLGGNVVLKLAGELGTAARGKLAGVAAISTPIDLDACCRRMMHWDNRLYENRFLSRLRARYLRRVAAYPDVFSADGLDRVRSVFEFDDRFTAPHFGFGTAENYYATQSSRNFIERIAVPTLLIQAQDDPLIPFEVYGHPSIAANRNVELVAPAHGGHVGFLSRRSPRFWADEAVRDWMVRLT